MALSVEYVAREMASNLWRNRIMTIAAVLTVTVSLSLVGAALLLRQGVQTATWRWRGGVSLSVFMNTNVTSSQQQAVSNELATDPRVKSFYWMDQQASYQEMKKLFANQPDLTSSVQPSDLPPSFRVKLVDASQAQAVGNQFNNQPGVKTVSYPGQAVKTLLRLTNVLQVVFFVVAVILLMSAAVLIINVIRMAIFARRREVAVMKLVGATNWFIRVPFMLEGLVQGLIGAMVAVWVVWLLDKLLNYFVVHDNLNLLNGLAPSGHDVIGTGIVVLFVGVLVGAVGSGLAVRRFLEV